MSIIKELGSMTCEFCRKKINAYTYTQHLTTRFCQSIQEREENVNEKIEHMKEEVERRKNERKKKMQEEKEQRKSSPVGDKKIIRYMLELSEDELENLPESIVEKLKKI